MVEAVLFDFDGVLLETSDLLYEGYRKVLSTFGIEYSEREFNTNYGLKTKEHFRKVLREKGIEQREEELEILVRTRDDIYQALCREQELVLLPGVKRLLEEIDGERTIMGIASSTSRVNLDFFLPQLGISDYFSATVAGNEAKRGKPHPEIYCTLCERLEVDPRKCVGIEDTQKGVEALDAAGITPIAVTFTNRVTYNFSQAAYIVRTMEELTYQRICNI